jgi:DNA invertase Pin-like site-specific DNA recombinase
MVYGYIRVSTDKQSVDNQRFEINRFCERNVLVVGKWVEESISGIKSVCDRELGRMLHSMKKNDILVCSELSWLGRNLLMIMGILNECMNRDIQVWTIKDNYRLGNDINCKVLAFAFGLSLARKRAEGVVLGRPKGSKSKVKKLTGRELEIQSLLAKKVPKAAIARILGVHKLTVADFVRGQEACSVTI